MRRIGELLALIVFLGTSPFIFAVVGAYVAAAPTALKENKRLAMELPSLLLAAWAISGSVFIWLQLCW